MGLKPSSAGVRRAIQQAGGITKLPTIDGPRLERWDPRKLAEALDQELARCAIEGWPKLSLHMDVRDAMKLAQYLRRL